MGLPHDTPKVCTWQEQGLMLPRETPWNSRFIHPKGGGLEPPQCQDDHREEMGIPLNAAPAPRPLGSRGTDERMSI